MAKSSGYHPSPPAPARLLPSEIREFREALEDSRLAKWIVFAGLGGIFAIVGTVAELCHLGWLAYRYLKGF